jgi:acetyl-CoA C-acetyltransferase/potassium large conductance calcium-activated channel subfamily M alpha protein 1
MIELVYPSNIEFLMTKEREFEGDFKSELTQLYAAGQVYNSTLIDTLTC